MKSSNIAVNYSRNVCNIVKMKTKGVNNSKTLFRIFMNQKKKKSECRNWKINSSNLEPIGLQVNVGSLGVCPAPMCARLHMSLIFLPFNPLHCDDRETAATVMVFCSVQAVVLNYGYCFSSFFVDAVRLP